MKTLFLILAVLMLAAPAVAHDISGSYVNLISPGPGNWDNGTYDVVFEVYNGSPDTEFLEAVEFTFEDCITVNSGTWDESCWADDWAFTTIGNVCLFYDTTVDVYGFHENDCAALYTVNVTVNCPNYTENLIEWRLHGDTWGEDPHVLMGVITGPVSNEASTWGNMKALFR